MCAVEQVIQALVATQKFARMDIAAMEAFVAVSTTSQSANAKGLDLGVQDALNRSAVRAIAKTVDGVRFRMDNRSVTVVERNTTELFASSRYVVQVIVSIMVDAVSEMDVLIASAVIQDMVESTASKPCANLAFAEIMDDV